MYTVLELPIERGEQAISDRVSRYSLLERATSSATRLGLVLLAFGLGPRELRFLVKGPAPAVSLFLRGLKGGTVRSLKARGVELRWGVSDARPVLDIPAAVAWVHAATGEDAPLTSPWTSHRDLLGYRRATFFDAAPLRALVDPEAVHARLANTPLPAPARELPPVKPPLQDLLVVSASCLGVLPTDRRCFRLFTHLASRCGWLSHTIARALALTPRRIRQLKSAPEPALPLALCCLADERLCVAP